MSGTILGAEDTPANETGGSPALVRRSLRWLGRILRDGDGRKTIAVEAELEQRH